LRGGEGKTERLRKASAQLNFKREMRGEAIGKLEKT
jgi:hypothetical protein